MGHVSSVTPAVRRPGAVSIGSKARAAQCAQAKNILPAFEFGDARDRRIMSSCRPALLSFQMGKPVSLGLLMRQTRVLFIDGSNDAIGESIGGRCRQ